MRRLVEQWAIFVVASRQQSSYLAEVPEVTTKEKRAETITSRPFAENWEGVSEKTLRRMASNSKLMLQLLNCFLMSAEMLLNPAIGNSS